VTQARIYRKDTGGYAIELDGIDIADRLKGVSFALDRTNMLQPVLRLDYQCYTITVDGEIETHHLCPLETTPT
jgi:hypothetical protein